MATRGAARYSLSNELELARELRVLAEPIVQQELSTFVPAAVRAVPASRPFSWLARGWQDLRRAPAAWRANTGSIALFGFALAFALISWERISAILFALFFGVDAPPVENVLTDLFFSGRYPGFSVTYIVAGALLAAVVFLVSVVSIPMMLDRAVDPVTAMTTSVRAAAASRGTMFIWAVTIVVLIAIGFATALLGLIVIVPLLGHATWHAYRDLVE